MASWRTGDRAGPVRGDRRAPVHEVIGALKGALRELGSQASTADIEQWGFSIHATLSAAWRQFHNHEHIMEVMADLDGLEVIAALYHDIVYLQADRGLPRSLRDQLACVLAPALGEPSEGPESERPPQAWSVLPVEPGSPASDVLAVFGSVAGEVVTPATGLNELASALVAAVQLQDALDRYQRIALAACIEQTIPFRPDPARDLHGRLDRLGLDDGQKVRAVERAVRFGNRDVANFASEDPRLFLQNTWKLLAEGNPALSSPRVYTVGEYRVALQKMEWFLGSLVPEHIFHRWGAEPDPEHHATRLRRAAANLGLARRYLRAKLYSIGVAEAIVLVTGGDVPLDYLMGGVVSPSESTPKRVEQFLPDFAMAHDVDPDLQDLLAKGRALESSFDTGPSPLGAFLYAAIGESTVMRGFEAACMWWAGDYGADAFIEAQPAKPVAGIARAAANIMETRRVGLLALAERLEQ